MKTLWNKFSESDILAISLFSVKLSLLLENTIKSFNSTYHLFEAVTGLKKPPSWMFVQLPIIFTQRIALKTQDGTGRQQALPNNARWKSWVSEKRPWSNLRAGRPKAGFEGLPADTFRRHHFWGARGSQLFQTADVTTERRTFRLANRESPGPHLGRGLKGIHYCVGPSFPSHQQFLLITFSWAILSRSHSLLISFFLFNKLFLCIVFLLIKYLYENRKEARADLIATEGKAFQQRHTI